MNAVSLVGVPSSAGSYAAGQDQAPTALRSAGLIDALRGSGLEVHDEGDLPVQIWRPDRLNPRAQNVGQVTESVQELIERLIPLLARGDTLLVLGGNCTVALGVAAALRRLSADPVGVFYVDRNYDLNTPESTTDGALDWMGMAHALALPGSLDVLVDVLGPRPLLEPTQVAWLGIDDRWATEWERTGAGRLGLQVISSDALAHDPVASAIESLEHLPGGPLAVHLGTTGQIHFGHGIEGGTVASRRPRWRPSRPGRPEPPERVGDRALSIAALCPTPSAPTRQRPRCPAETGQPGQ
jgi:arginase